MKTFENPLLAIAAPLLVLLSILGLLHRQGSDRLQSLPPLLVGCGLIISAGIGRRQRRKKLLMAIRKSNQELI